MAEARLRQPLPRLLHPGAWWLWASSLAVAASRTTNPWLLLALLGVVGIVVAERRVPGPWSRAFLVFVQVGMVVVGIRMVLAAVLAGPGAGPVLLTLPSIALPDWLAGVRVGGPVTADTVLEACYEGLRLAVILGCIGAANALVLPSRLLRVVPAALYEIGVAVVVILTVLPMLVADLGRVREARLLRGRRSRPARAAAEMTLPVLNGALDRAVTLAAAMDSRGYGRTTGVSAGTRRLTTTLVLAGLVGVGVGLYGVLDGGTPDVAGLPVLGWPMVLLGCTLAVAATLLAGRRIGRTVYRPDRWRAAEWAVLGSGLACLSAILVSAALGVDLEGPTSPPTWPTLPLVPALGVLLGLLALPASPPVPLAAGPRQLPSARPREPAR